MKLPEHKMVNTGFPLGYIECEKDCLRCAVNKVIDLVKPYLDHKADCLSYRSNYIDALMDGQMVERECNCGVDELLKELEETE
jgi:hypothetical protein